METESTHQPYRGHEKLDASSRALAASGLVLVAALALTLLSMKSLFDYLAKIQPLGPPKTPFEDTRTLPPPPRLQVTPAADLELYREQQRQILNTYDWVDRSNNLVRIPIDRAMDLVLERGLPYRQESSGSKSATPSQANGTGVTGQPTSADH